MNLLRSFLISNTPESLMRLLSFMSVVTGCIFIISIIVYLFYSLINGIQVNLMGIAACISAAATLIGTGIAGKAYQKRFEQYTSYSEEGYSGNEYNQNNTSLPPGYGEGESEGV